MKWIKMIGHPVVLAIFFLLLLIEGKHFGGFYLLYLWLTLPAGAPYAILALCGLVCVFIGYKIGRGNGTFIKPVLYLVGFFLMILSLIIFFHYGDKSDTFKLLIPLLSFILLSISSACFLINAIYLLLKLNAAR